LFGTEKLATCYSDSLALVAANNYKIIAFLGVLAGISRIRQDSHSWIEGDFVAVLCFVSDKEVYVELTGR
jgi:hypothetical protein